MVISKILESEGMTLRGLATVLGIGHGYLWLVDRGRRPASARLASVLYWHGYITADEARELTPAPCPVIDLLESGAITRDDARTLLG